MFCFHGFTLLGYQNRKFATDPALEKILHFFKSTAFKHCAGIVSTKDISVWVELP